MGGLGKEKEKEEKGIEGNMQKGRLFKIFWFI